MDVCLLNMPYAGLERPSIALGILEAILKQDNRTYRSIYANLSFAEHIGEKIYYWIGLTRNEDLLGEWTFATAAFPDFSPDPDAYFDLFRDMPRSFREKLMEVREKSRSFINNLAAQVLAMSPRIVGCTSSFQQNCASLALLRAVKEGDPSIITMMGGANCETHMGVALLKTAPWIDYIVSGEAEELFSTLITRLLEGRPSTDNDPLNPAVLCGRQVRSDKKEQKTIPRAVVKQMDTAPIPEFDSYFAALNASKLRAAITPGLLMETSRGCWWGAKHHCTFCGLNGEGMAYRSKTPTRVLDEFSSLAAKHKVYQFEIVDNILDMQYMDTVLPQLAGLRKRYNIFYETKSNLRKSQVQKLARAGVKWIQPGIESLHDQFLKLIDKGVEAIQNIQLLKWCRELGIRVSWNMLCGAPGESDQWYKEMAGFFPLLAHLQPPQGITSIRYDRFSPYFNLQEQYGLQLVPSPCYAYVYPVDKVVMNDLAYFFEDDSTRQLKKPIGRDPLKMRPGQRDVESCIYFWAEGFWAKSGRPLLCIVDRPDGLRLIDTRPVAVARNHSFQGLAAAIYRACSEAITPKVLLTKIQMEQQYESITWEDVQEKLDMFVDKKLLLFLSGKYLALALEGNVPPVPGIEDFPGGYLNFADVVWEYQQKPSFLGTLT